MAEEKTGWNVPEVEDLIMTQMSFARMKKEMDSEVEGLLNALFGRNEAGMLLKNMTMELRAIVHNTEDNKTGYHLNCIHSGKTMYDVILPPQNADDEEQEIKLIGTFDDEDEAMEHMEDGMILCPFDPEEWWAILDTNGKNATGMLYPTDIRAMAFLLHIAEPPAWTAYYQYRKENSNE